VGLGFLHYTILEKLTSHQAKYFAYELSRRFPSGSPERFNVALVDAQVDLNPHQVEAALFAFQSPLSKGAILADEVGLGKTIEAGILLSQLWAEQKRKLLIICPANLRKQWSQELRDKFFLDSLILENKNFNEFRRVVGNPFDANKVVICSYQFIKSKADFVQLISWDLVIIDEAHRLRNVYKFNAEHEKPQSVLAGTIQNCLSGSRKILLTATPLQNTLLELYGLVSIIDEHTFGDIKSFRTQFLRTADGDNFQDLRDRLKSVCIRNLRRQVQEYIKYTNRIPLTIRFEPTPEEHKLYEDVSTYLQQELLFALPVSQRHLMTLILRKLLASSSFAIAGTLGSLIKKLEEVVRDQQRKSVSEEISKDYEIFEEQKEEWIEEEENDEENKLASNEIELIKKEIDQLTQFKLLAESIKQNAKGNKLMSALKEGFEKMQMGAAQKAIIFTESTRTQNYLYQLLDKEYPGKIVLFNGSNNDEQSNKIYKHWKEVNFGTERITGSPTADKRAALVDYFRNEAIIMIATEAAAEGINLQFCSLLINYDLPWNPQRIEQRIGRCHRYGQKYDVVVVNFLNVKNAADVRVFQLLDEKFKLFSGVFGASDDVLGTIESGVDFEKRIGEIYQKCRTPEQIIEQFDKLQKELDEQISKKMLATRETLLENFDEEVVEKLRIRLSKSQEYVSKYERWLWDITRFELNNKAAFGNEYSFQLHSQPFPDVSFPLEQFKLGKDGEQAHTYRIGHDLAQRIIAKLKAEPLNESTLVFDLTNYEGNIAVLQSLNGKKGWLVAVSVTVESFESTDHLLLIGCTHEGDLLTEDQVRRMLNLEARHESHEALLASNELILERKERSLTELLKVLKERDNTYLRAETEKLYKWADDRVTAAEQMIKDTKIRIKELNRESQKTTDPEALLKLQYELQELSRKQKRQRQEIFTVEDEIAEQRNKMIADIEQRMKQNISQQELFRINWQLV
jgi:ERCC4-related helicase